MLSEDVRGISVDWQRSGLPGAVIELHGGPFNTPRTWLARSSSNTGSESGSESL
jgi:hypothetical protein